MIRKQTINVKNTIYDGKNKISITYKKEDCQIKNSTGFPTNISYNF